MTITGDVKAGQCKICLQGISNPVPVLELGRTAGIQVWVLSICKKCAAEMRQQLDEFLHPKDD